MVHYGVMDKLLESLGFEEKAAAGRRENPLATKSNFVSQSNSRSDELFLAREAIISLFQILSI